MSSVLLTSPSSAHALPVGLTKQNADFPVNLGLGDRVLVWEDEKCLEMDGSDGCTMM